MISSNSNEPNGKSILASLGLVGLAIVIHWCYLDFELSSLQDREETERRMIDSEEESNRDQSMGEDPNGLDTDNGNGNESGDGDAETFYFPWEPNYEPHESRNSNTRERRATSLAADAPSKSSPSMVFGGQHGRHQTQGTKHSQKEQLDFLASMTFANGGLRSPSCPCCV